MTSLSARRFFLGFLLLPVLKTLAARPSTEAVDQAAAVKANGVFVKNQHRQQEAHPHKPVALVQADHNNDDITKDSLADLSEETQKTLSTLNARLKEAKQKEQGPPGHEGEEHVEEEANHEVNHKAIHESGEHKEEAHHEDGVHESASANADASEKKGSKEAEEGDNHEYGKSLETTEAAHLPAEDLQEYVVPKRDPAEIEDYLHKYRSQWPEPMKAVPKGLFTETAGTHSDLVDAGMAIQKHVDDVDQAIDKVHGSMENYHKSIDTMTNHFENLAKKADEMKLDVNGEFLERERQRNCAFENVDRMLKGEAYVPCEKGERRLSVPEEGSGVENVDFNRISKQEQEIERRQDEEAKANGVQEVAHIAMEEPVTHELAQPEHENAGAVKNEVHSETEEHATPTSNEVPTQGEQAEETEDAEPKEPEETKGTATGTHEADA